MKKSVPRPLTQQPYTHHPTYAINAIANSTRTSWRADPRHVMTSETVAAEKSMTSATKGRVRLRLPGDGSRREAIGAPSERERLRDGMTPTLPSGRLRDSRSGPGPRAWRRACTPPFHPVRQEQLFDALVTLP
jgi:hypothetical protein